MLKATSITNKGGEQEVYILYIPHRLLGPVLAILHSVNTQNFLRAQLVHIFFPFPLKTCPEHCWRRPAPALQSPTLSWHHLPHSHQEVCQQIMKKSSLFCDEWHLKQIQKILAGGDRPQTMSDSHGWIITSVSCSSCAGPGDIIVPRCLRSSLFVEF